MYIYQQCNVPNANKIKSKTPNCVCFYVLFTRNNVAICDLLVVELFVM